MHPAPFPATPSARPMAANAQSSESMRRACRSVESLVLLQGQREVLIRHGDETYRLRHTRNNKLILTK
jgi:hemin uptake protein HemP